MNKDTHGTNDADEQHTPPDDQAVEDTSHLPTTRRTFLGSIAAASALGGGGTASALGDGGTAAAMQGGGAGALAQEAASSHGYGIGGYGAGPYGGDTNPQPGGPPALPGQDNAPQDLNGDGLYRDVNGDGQFTIADVQVFFIHRNSNVVQNNAEFFNFDREDPPAVSIRDVQALFLDLTEGINRSSTATVDDGVLDGSLGDLGDPESAADLDVRTLFGGE